MRVRHLWACCLAAVVCSLPACSGPEEPPPAPVAAAPAPAFGHVDEIPDDPEERTIWALKGLAEHVGKKYPFPQDHARIRTVRAERLERARALTTDVFAAHGNGNAAWAEQARAALEAVAEYIAEPDRHKHRKEAARRDTLTAAVAAGCDDPLVRYYAAVVVPPRPRDLVGEYGRLIAVMERKGYPAERRMHSLWNLYVACYDRGRPVTAPAYARDVGEQFWGVLAEVAAQKTPDGDAAVYDVVENVRRLSAELPGGTTAGAERFAAALDKAGASAWLKNAVRGYFLLMSGWEARGSGLGDTVTPERAALFEERLGLAEAALTAAWEADPTRPGPACGLISVATGRGHPREVMEMWFRRALEADPDDHSAVWRKAEYLHPKWYGAVRETDLWPYYAQCHATGNHHAGLTMLYFDHKIAKMLPFPENDATFFPVQPQVQALVNDAFRGYLTAYPDDRLRRSQFFCASAAFKNVGHAQEQLDRLKGDLLPVAFGKRTAADFRTLHLANGGTEPK